MFLVGHEPWIRERASSPGTSGRPPAPSPLSTCCRSCEHAALQRDKDDVPRYCALACIGEARGKLRVPARPGEHHALPHARRLSRGLAALCDHYEALTEVVMCLACDQPLRDGEDTQPYDHISPSGPVVRVGRIHARCAHTYRRH
jgi:hypothetical protein